MCYRACCGSATPTPREKLISNYPLFPAFYSHWPARRGASGVAACRGHGPDQQIAALCPTHDVVALDLLGHGLSGQLAGELSFRRFAVAVAQLIEDLGAGPVHLVGISCGSMVAQTVAVEHPALVCSLALIGAACTFTEAGRQALRARANFVRHEGLVALAPLSLARWFTSAFSQRRPDVLDRVTKLLGQQEPAYHAALWELIATLDTQAGLAPLGRPWLSSARKTPVLLARRLIPWP
ncbi:MAG: alpha/beta fold hydrolase [Hymenobacter sp.]|nr:MAG: alpha/beta fold hydrolase [Hymenobacter sp.]